MNIGQILLNLWNDSGFATLGGDGWKSLLMIAIGCGLLYLGIAKKFEPLLLCGIAFGCILTNLPGANLYHQELWTAFMNHEIGYGQILQTAACWTFSILALRPAFTPV